jgi:phenylacetate-CoA ligase
MMSKNSVGRFLPVASILRSLRRQSPLTLQRRYGLLRRSLARRSIWHDKEFRRCYAWLEETQWWSREQLADYQLSQLRRLVRHAYENVPYYQRVFDQHYIVPDDIMTLEDLPTLPLLTRSDVRGNLDDLVARNVDRKSLTRKTTGGSTSQPLVVYHFTPESGPHDSAFMLRQWCWAGYRFGDPIVSLRPRFAPNENGRGQRRWWHYNPDNNELQLSVFDLSEGNLCYYVKKIREFKPRYINALPSSLQILSN